MQEHRSIGPAVRRRLLEAPDGEKITLRALTAEFGKFIAPELAYRRWQQTGGELLGMMSAVTLTQEQQVALGRMRFVSDALQRLGARFDGPRTLSPERRYWLPEDQKAASRKPSGGTSFLTLPTPATAIAHLEARFTVLDSGKSKSFSVDDRRACQSLINLARRAERAGLVSDLLQDDGEPS